MSETVNDYVPGRSLFAEITDLKDQMAALKTAMLEMVDLQRDMHTKLDTMSRDAVRCYDFNAIQRYDESLTEHKEQPHGT